MQGGVRRERGQNCHWGAGGRERRPGWLRSGEAVRLDLALDGHREARDGSAFGVGAGESCHKGAGKHGGRLGERDWREY